MAKRSWQGRTVASITLVAVAALIVPGTPIGWAKPLADDDSPQYRTPDSARIEGADRYATTAALAAEGWNRSEYVVIASGDSFADGLVAGPLAHAYDAPLLLTRARSLPTPIVDAIARLRATKAIVVGGRSRISDDVLAQLGALGVTSVERIAGADRYDTSRLVAERMADLEPFDVVIVASGARFADSLSIAGMAAFGGMPILLTRQDALSPAAAAVIDELAPENTIVVGGVRVVSDAAAGALPGVTRIGGQDRYDTARLAGEYGFQVGYHDFSTVYVATGLDYADALALGPLAARRRACLVLSRPDHLPEPAYEFFVHHASSIDDIVLVGGRAALSPTVHGEAIESAQTIIRSDVEVLDTVAVTGMEEQPIGTEGGNRILIFDGDADGVDVIDTGDVIIHAGSDEAAPFLLKTLDVQETPEGDISVEATQASLDQAIQKGSIDVRCSGPEGVDALPEEDLAVGNDTWAFGPLDIGGVLKDPWVNNKPIKGLSLSVDLRLRGSFTFNLAWGFIGWDGLAPVFGFTHSDARFVLDEDLAIALELTKCVGVSWDSELDGWDALDAAPHWQPEDQVYPVLNPWSVFWVECVPVTWRIMRRSVMGFEAGMDIDARVAFDQHARLALGYEWDRNEAFVPRAALDARAGAETEFNVAPNLTAGAFFGNKLRLVLYETMVPYVGAKIGAKAHVAPTKNPWCYLDASGDWMIGIDFSICERVDLFAIEKSGTLVGPREHWGWTPYPFPDPTWRWDTAWKWHIPGL